MHLNCVDPRLDRRLTVPRDSPNGPSRHIPAAFQALEILLQQLADGPRRWPPGEATPDIGRAVAALVSEDLSYLTSAR